MNVSKLSGRGQTTIPLAVRKALRLHEGDSLHYHIEHGRVILTRAEPVVQDDPFALFNEWAGDVDSRAYSDL